MNRSKLTKQSLAGFPEHSAENPLSIHAMTVAYQHKPVLWNIDYDAPPNSLVAIVGPNGAGKSTLIKAALGILPRLSGTVEYWGEPYTKARKAVGYVPQRESVDWDFPVSALDVVCMGRYGMIGWFGRVSKAHKNAAMNYLADVGMEQFAHRQINQLSGGQQQRVFLARALAQEANLYFMDEPFSGVDATTEKAIVQTLGSLKDSGKTVICVHHDLTTVAEYFDHVLLLNTRVIASGTVADTFSTENLQKTYSGRLTLLDEVSEVIRQEQRGEP